MSYESFSHRQGFVRVDKTIQQDWMSDDLRNSLWNAIKEYYLDPNKKFSGTFRPFLEDDLKELLYLFIKNYLKRSTDILGSLWEDSYLWLKEIFFNSDFNVCYDIVEFFSHFYNRDHVNKLFIKEINQVLEREFSGYRFIDNQIVPISSKEEIEEIDGALNSYSPVADHLKKALNKISNRKKPDYQNSIKESISAVESLCSRVSSENTLGAALKEIEKSGVIKIHPALKDSFIKIYGYTSDSNGIRHANKFGEGDSVDFEEAKYMLVSCSAFINYLKVKIDKADIKI